MLADRTDGVTYDPAISLATIRKIKEFARMGDSNAFAATAAC